MCGTNDTSADTTDDMITAYIYMYMYTCISQYTHVHVHVHCTLYIHVYTMYKLLYSFNIIMVHSLWSAQCSAH